MSIIQEKLREARAERDRAIGKARGRYYQALREIRNLARELGENYSRRYLRIKPTGDADGDLAHLTAIGAMEQVLREQGPMRMHDIVRELQRRGCRTGDDPRAVAHGLRSAIQARRGQFVLVEGEWGVRE